MRVWAVVREEAGSRDGGRLGIARCGVHLSCREGLLKHRLPGCTPRVSDSVDLGLGRQSACLAVPTDSCTALSSTFLLPWVTLALHRRLSLELRTITARELPPSAHGAASSDGDG